MADDKAQVRVGIEGVEDVVSGVERIKGSFASVGETVGRNLGPAVGAVVKGVADLGQTVTHVVTAVSALNFGEAVKQAGQLNEAFARFAVVAGGSVDLLKAKFGELSKTTFLSESELQASSRALGVLTHDFRSAVDAQKGLAQEAMATGKSAGDMQQLGVVLHDVLGVTGDTTKALGLLRAQADALGTIGGPAAFQEQISALGGAMSKVSLKTEADRNKLTGFMGLAGQGLEPEQAKRVQSAILGGLSSNVFDLNFTLNRDVLDEQGHMKDPAKVLADLRRSWTKRGLGRYQQLVASRSMFGDEAGSIVAGLDLSQIDALANVTPAAIGGGTAAFGATAEGQRKQLELQAERDKRRLAEPMLAAQESWMHLFSGSPLLSALSGTLLAGGVSAGFRGLGGLAGRIGRGGGGGVEASAAAVVAAGMGAAADAQPVRVVNWNEAPAGGGILGAVGKAAPAAAPAAGASVVAGAAGVSAGATAAVEGLGALLAAGSLPVAIVAVTAAAAAMFREQRRGREDRDRPSFERARERRDAELYVDPSTLEPLPGDKPRMIPKKETSAMLWAASHWDPKTGKKGLEDLFTGHLGPGVDAAGELERNQSLQALRDAILDPQGRAPRPGDLPTQIGQAVVDALHANPLRAPDPHSPNANVNRGKSGAPASN